MVNEMNDIFMMRYPQMDLHGYDRDSARMMVNDFIRDNYEMGIDTIIIIHGKGLGILRKEVHEALRINKLVLEYKSDNFNDGCTIVRIITK